MDVIQPVKRLVEKATGIGIPSREEALACVRDVQPSRLRFRLGRRHDPAAILEQIFMTNGWGDAWRNGIYDFVHYHARIHEVLGIARGSASLRLGGNKGKTVKVGAGDVIVVPAGVGHECLNASSTFLVVGAYPPAGIYNEYRGSFQERERATKVIRRVSRPMQHPLYGRHEALW